MADTLVFLQLEHRALVRMLHLLEQICQELEEHAPVDAELLTLILDYLRDYPDTCHHPKEDLVLRRLEQREPQVAEHLRHLLGDHEALHAWTLRIAERARLDPSFEGEGFTEELCRFAQHYRAHLDHEDREFFPAVREHLEREDWDLIDFHLFDRSDPLYDARAENRFRTLRDMIFDTAAEDPPREGKAEN